MLCIECHAPIAWLCLCDASISLHTLEVFHCVRSPNSSHTSTQSSPLPRLLLLRPLTTTLTQYHTNLITELGLAEHFDFVLTSEETKTEKPNREIFDMAMSKTKCSDPTTAYHVGTSIDSDVSLQYCNILSTATVMLCTSVSLPPSLPCLPAAVNRPVCAAAHMDPEPCTTFTLSPLTYPLLSYPIPTVNCPTTHCEIPPSHFLLIIPLPLPRHPHPLLPISPSHLLPSPPLSLLPLPSGHRSGICWMDAPPVQRVVR